MRKVITSLIFIISALQLNGQINADSIFNSAILNAQEGKYDKALDDAALVLELFPERYDVMVFSANVNAWKGDYAAALVHINKAYVQNKTNNALYDSWLNILLWSKDYHNLLRITRIAEQNNYQNKYNIVLKEVIAYKSLAKYKEGIATIEDNKSYLDSTSIEALYDEMQMMNRNRALSFYYSVDLYDQDVQHLSYIDYTFKKGKHTIVPRFGYAHRFDLNDFQVEVDYYHSFENGHYIYSNYGLGIKQELYPLHKLGFEYYLPLPKSFETSLGARYFYANSTSTVMLTGHISKTFHKLWLSLKPFYVFNDAKNVLSTVFNAKYYGLNPINYWGLELAYGNSPDERYYVGQTPEIFVLDNYRIKIEKNTAIYKYGEIKFSAGYSYEEYFSDLFRNRLRFEVLLKHKF